MERAVVGATKTWELVFGDVTEVVGEVKTESLELGIGFTSTREVFRCSAVLFEVFAFRTTFSLSSRNRRDSWSR
jgi:hypothetical protein